MDKQRSLRTVTIPDHFGGRVVSLGAYLKAWRMAKSLATDTPLAGGFARTAGEALQVFRAGLDDRISCGVPRSAPWKPERPTWRKLSSEYQLRLRRDANRLRGYGGMGRKLECPEVARRLGAQYVTVLMSGAVVLHGAEERE